jgi:hypothetical protein
MNNFNALYFSCGRDEEMLMNSIFSLTRTVNPDKIFVANDLNDPIKNKHSWIYYIDKKKSTEKLYGLDNIAEMLRIFEIASEGADYLQKIDSDTLVCSDYAYKNLDENNWDCYGSFPMAIPEMIPPKHFAGPSYFIKSEIAKELKKFSEQWPKCVYDWSWMNFPEDMVISSLCNILTQNIQVDGTAMHKNGNYLFDTYMTKIACEDKDIIKKYGFAHCRTTPSVVKYLKEKIYENN